MGHDTFWPFAIAVVVTGLSTIVYTFLGGIRAVFWMDAIQFVVYMAGAVVALVLLIHLLPGGLMQYVSIGSEYDKFRVLDFSWNFTLRDTFWAGLIGGALLSMATHGTDQLMVQRYLAARSPRDAKVSLALSGFVVLGQFALVLLIGVGLFVFYKQFEPDMLARKSDYVFPRFIVEQMPLGVRGLLLAAIFSAAMSTLSSSLNSSSAALVSDFYRPRLRPGAEDAHYFRAGRWFTIGFGLMQMGIAFAGLALSGPVVDSVLAIAGFTTGIVLGVFFLGRLTRRVDARAALIGLTVGAAVMTAVAFAPKVWESLPAIAWPWYALIGSSVTFAAGLVASTVGSRTSQRTTP
jgi:SSS family solute:Na+ symporter